MEKKNQPLSPYEAAPPPAKRLLRSVALAIIGAAAILVLVVLPAEYGIDLTGAGRAMGLTQIHAPPRKLEIQDVIGGNEDYQKAAVVDAGQPVPLPNPAVVQIKAAEPASRTITVTLKPDEQTEIKAIMDAAQVILYSWKAEGGEVYTDFHGHEPSAGDAFVRYEEQQSGTHGDGSLVAPFSGEHGWYWLSLSDQPVTITLKVSGYFNDIKDYGLIK